MKEGNPLREFFEDIESVCHKHYQTVSDNGYYGKLMLTLDNIKGGRTEWLGSIWEKPKGDKS